jgi:hypothetical protein
MMLDVRRLRDSDLAAGSSGEAFRAAVLLWCVAWHQTPASSLPNDDRALARYAGFGRDMDGWMQVKEQALHGFTLCDDGLYYHSVIAEKALECFANKAKKRARVAAATAARLAHSKRNGAGDDHHLDTRNEERNDAATDIRHENRREERSDANDTTVTTNAASTNITELNRTELSTHTSSPSQEPARAQAQATPAGDPWLDLCKAIAAAFDEQQRINPETAKLCPSTHHVDIWARSVGYDPVICRSIVLAGIEKKKGNISHLKLFDDAIFDAHAAIAEKRATAEAAKREKALEREGAEPAPNSWGAWVKLFKETGGQWLGPGPAPDDLNCRAPIGILRQYGYAAEETT